jgi:hypothetical protein
MNPHPHQQQANAAAEEILRLIYGDDLQGCAVSLDAVADVILQALDRNSAQQTELLQLHEKVVEAVDFLSTPPDRTINDDPTSLLPLLSERLDAIHTITQKLNSTAALIKQHGLTGSE